VKELLKCPEGREGEGAKRCEGFLWVADQPMSAAFTLLTPLVYYMLYANRIIKLH